MIISLNYVLLVSIIISVLQGYSSFRVMYQISAPLVINQESLPLLWIKQPLFIYQLFIRVYGALLMHKDMAVFDTRKENAMLHTLCLRRA